MTKIDTPVPDTIGAPFGGGFFAGVFLLDGRPHALIVAPKAEGEAQLPWKTKRTTTAGARSLRDGLANSNAMANGDHPAAAFCRDLSIGGFTDWYLPSRHEAALLAENLMPDEAQLSDRFVSPCQPPEGLERELLTVLAEECTEVGQRVCKALRFGLQEVQSGQPWNNAQRIALEIGDLLEVVDRLKALGVIRDVEIEAGQDSKSRQLAKFLQAQN